MNRPTKSKSAKPAKPHKLSDLEIPEDPESLDVISNDPALQHEYEDLVTRGMSPKLAEMLVLQSPPTLSTDTRFLQGHHENGFYSHQLARFPNDPEAYVSSRREVLEAAKRRGMKLEGGHGMNHTPAGWGEAEAEQPYQVADDLVDSAMQDIADKHPEAVQDSSLRESVKKRLSGQDE